MDGCSLFGEVRDGCDTPAKVDKRAIARMNRICIHCGNTYGEHWGGLGAGLYCSRSGTGQKFAAQKVERVALRTTSVCQNAG